MHVHACRAPIVLRMPGNLRCTQQQYRQITDHCNNSTGSVAKCICECKVRRPCLPSFGYRVDLDMQGAEADLPSRCWPPVRVHVCEAHILRMPGSASSTQQTCRQTLVRLYASTLKTL